MISRSALVGVVSKGYGWLVTQGGEGFVPLHAPLVRDQAARQLWKVGVHQINNVFQILLSTAEIRLSHLVFALPASPSAHLASARAKLAYPGSPCIMMTLTYNMAGPTRSRPIRALLRITRRAGT